MLNESNKFHMILQSHVRRCTIHFVPEEILFKILILLPAETLYNVARYVCRQWYAIIQDPEFISGHFLLSTTSLLRRKRYLSIGRGVWENYYQRLDVKDSCADVTHFKFVVPYDVRVYSTCNGLVLIGSVSKRTHYVGNPITRKLLALPKLSSSMTPYWSSLAVSATSGLYKVVRPYHDERSGSDSRCAILTVGVDEAWRVLDFSYLKLPYRNFFFLEGNQVVISGFVYWIPQYQMGFIYALDVDSEIVKLIALPNHDTAVLYDDTKKKLLPKGNSISLLVYYPDFSMEVWVLKDTRSEEWVKFRHIEGEPIRNKWVNILSHYKISTEPEFFYYACPIFWLGNDDKILFGVSFPGFGREFFVYDLNTHACSEFDKKCDRDCEFVPFMNSLAWI